MLLNYYGKTINLFELRKNQYGSSSRGINLQTIISIINIVITLMFRIADFHNNIARMPSPFFHQ